MKIPKEFYINGKLWTVSYERAFGQDGLTDQTNRHITLRRELPKAEKLETFLHEFIHAALFELHLSGPSAALPDSTEEILCTGLASILINTFELKMKKG